MDSPQSLPDSTHHASLQTHIWGGFVIAILTVVIVALLYFLCSKKLIPALRRRREEGKLSPKKHALKGEQNLTCFQQLALPYCSIVGGPNQGSEKIAHISLYKL